MKSIVEEASSIEKAITSAWNRAGKPKKFTITIFQEPEKNFFGMTTTPAKIGFMFEERAVKHTVKPEPPKKEILNKDHKGRSNAPAERRIEKPAIHKPIEMPMQPASKPVNKFWTDEMITAAKGWLEKTLRLSNNHQASFSIKPQRQHLKIEFAAPLSTDPKKEKTMFRSFAHLIMQAQRTAFKKPLKHHKVILTSK